MQATAIPVPCGYHRNLLQENLYNFICLVEVAKYHSSGFVIAIVFIILTLSQLAIHI